MRPLALPDEGRYVSVAWEMLRSGDWLVPTLDGLPYFHKPPLMYWLTAAALAVDDSSLLAARIAPLLGAYLAAASLFLFARRWAAPGVARASLLALATAPLFYAGAQYANLDMLVGGCITATVLAFAHAALLEPGDPARRKVLLAAYALCALGVLAKGLIGIVLPGMVLFLWLAGERRWAAMLRLLWLPGVALFLVIAAPWFVLMQQRFEGFMHYYFVVQHFQRYSQATFNNPQPFWFYPAVLLVLALPWTLWLLGARKLPWRGPEAGASVRRLMAWWIVSITLFFSLPHSKLVGYIFPAVAPMLFLAGEAVAALQRRRLATASAVIGAVVCLIVIIGVYVKGDRSQAAVGQAIRESMQPGDTVIALEEHRFAIPYEARLSRPMVVVADWSPEAVGSRDNWRKELADAAVFAPAQDWLISRAQLPARVCASKTSWLLGAPAVLKDYPWLAQAQRIRGDSKLALWRVDATSPVRTDLCRGTPSASSRATS
jgi:4-amino-4-deoxy-L-arabinose transferase-like glycosyltransferase